MYSSSYRQQSRPFKLETNDFEAEQWEWQGMPVGLKFAPSISTYSQMNLIASATIDGFLGIWDIAREQQKTRLVFDKRICESLWSFCWDPRGEMIFFAEAQSGSIGLLKDGRSDCIIPQCHKEPVHTLGYWEQQNCLISIGYDRIIFGWDMRDLKRPVFTLETPRTGSAAIGKNLLMTMSDGNHTVTIYDMNEVVTGRNPQFVKFEAGTEGQIVRCAVSRSDSRVALASVSGEVQCVPIDLKALPKDARYYERKSSDSGFYLDHVHKDGMSIDQVNDVVFHPEKEYFVGSCSSSGTISFCNTSSKKKTKSFKYSDKWPVACMDLNRDASLMAAVMGNDYHEGWEGREKYLHPNLILRKTNSSSFSASYGSTSYGSYGSGRGGTSTGGGYGYSRY